MPNKIFEAISCGETLPVKNVHAVSVSMPKLQDVIDYEECEPEVLKKIKSAYPRFILHPYVKLLALFMKEKYKISNEYEVVVVSSQKAVDIISDKYFIHNNIYIKEDFGVILVLKGTSQLQKVLTFIQHVGCNLSSRFAQDYLYKYNKIESVFEEKLEKKENSLNIIKSTLALAYNQNEENICLAPSGMNAIYSILKGLKAIQDKNSRTIIIQLGWLYLDTMNIIKNHYDRSKTFLDINNLDLLANYLKKNGNKISAIITEVPTNPLLQTVDLIKLKSLCIKYNIPLIIDSTLATPYNLDLKPYADIYIESLTKYACGNADVLMGAFIINEQSNLKACKAEFFKHADKPYIKDIQRLAYEIKCYETRMNKINENAIKLIKYLKKQNYVKDIYYTLANKYKDNYKPLMRHDKAVGGLISLTFTKNFEKIYDKLNFAKGPSLGTEFTLLMPYVYLAHYDLIISKKGREELEQNNIPINLLRIAIGVEDINAIITEFDKIKTL